MLIDKFLEIIDSLDQYNVDYIIIGGLALIIYGSPRFTEDMALFLKHDDSNINKLRNALNSFIPMNQSRKKLSMNYKITRLSGMVPLMISTLI